MPPNANYELRVTIDDPDLPSSSVPGTAEVLPVNLTSSSNSTDNDFGFDIARPNFSVNKSSTVFSRAGSSGFSIPGEDMEYSVQVINTGGEGMDIDSVIIFDQLPDNLTFFHDDFDGSGAATVDPLVFQQTGTSLDFDYARDVRYSDAVAPPVSFGDCNYAPTIGYDPNITYICVNPKGVMRVQSSNPSFTLKFRMLIN